MPTDLSFYCFPLELIFYQLQNRFHAFAFISSRKSISKSERVSYKYTCRITRSRKIVSSVLLDHSVFREECDAVSREFRRVFKTWSRVCITVYRHRLTLIDSMNNYRSAKDYEADEKSPRVIPECLDALSKRTGFSKEEIRRMYRAFKQHCPGGAATINDLKLVYAKIFPLGDSTKYAQIVFSKFDKDKDGLISFGDLIAGLTCIVKGTTEQKLSWIFGWVFN